MPRERVTTSDIPWEAHNVLTEAVSQQALTEHMLATIKQQFAELCELNERAEKLVDRLLCLPRMAGEANHESCPEGSINSCFYELGRVNAELASLSTTLSVLESL